MFKLFTFTIFTFFKNIMKRKDGFPGQLSYVIPLITQNSIKENILTADLYLTDIGYYPDARYHYRQRKNGVSQSILIYCSKGKGNVQIENKSHNINEDEFIIIPKNKSHTYYSDNHDPWSIYWIHFAGEKAQKIEQYGEQIFAIDKGTDSRTNYRLMLFEDIFKNLERGLGMDTLEYVNMCLTYLLASFIHIDQFRTINKSFEKDPISLGINYMLENIHTNIRLPVLAKEVKLSVSHFSRLFLSKTGQSPIDYFNQLKIQRACQLMNHSSITIGEIAREIGYNDQFHFSRVFKKIMGVSPREYRNKL